MDGLAFFESFWLNHHTCGGLPIWFKFPSLGASSLPLFLCILCSISSLKQFTFTCRAMHEVEIRPKGGVTRLQFFLVVLVSSFAYYIVPNYLFPSITALSFMCWMWKGSITAQQIGSGLNGLGLGSFALDWSTAASFLGSPLATPGFAIINILIGFFIVTYIVIPIAYWTNSYEARRFPIFSADIFDADGGSYNVSRVLNYTTFEFNQQGYDGYSKIN